jgi:hypothetical protein
LNLKRQAAVRQLSDASSKDGPQLVGPRVPRRLTAAEVRGGAPLKVKAAVIPFLAALSEYADLSDEVVIEMARQKVNRRLHIPDRWVAIAVLLGTREILPVRLR